MARLVAALVAALVAGVYLEDMASWLGLVSSPPDSADSSLGHRDPSKRGFRSRRPKGRPPPLFPAYDESLGFFDDVPAPEWALMKRRVRDLQPNTERDPYVNLGNPAVWFQNNYEPEFSCRHERRIGGTAPRGSLGAGGVTGGKLGSGSNSNTGAAAALNQLQAGEEGRPQLVTPQLGPNGQPLERLPTGQEVRDALLAASAEDDRLGRGMGEGGKWVCDPHRLAGKTAEEAVREEEEREAAARNAAPGREEHDVKMAAGMQRHHQVAGQHAVVLAPGRTSASLRGPPGQSGGPGGAGAQNVRSAAGLPPSPGSPSALSKKKKEEEDDDDRPPCLVYSVGSRDEFSFERGVLSQIGPHCRVHTFDMDVNHTLAKESGVESHGWGWARQARVHKPSGRTYKTPLESVKELRHHGDGNVIDVLKLDCDGCEWEIFPLLFESGMPTIRQLLVELHEDVDDETGAGTIRSPETMAFFREMHRRGYVIFHKEANVHFWHVARCVEYGFLKLHDSFFQGA